MPTRQSIRVLCPADSFLTFSSSRNGAFSLEFPANQLLYDYEGGAGNHAYDPNVIGQRGLSQTTGAYQLPIALAGTPTGPSAFLSDPTASEGDVHLTSKSVK